MLARLAQLFRRALPSPPPQVGEGRTGVPGWVGVGELRRWLAGEGAPIVVDVRGPDEFPGSKAWDWTPDRLPRLPVVAPWCAVPRRSREPVRRGGAADLPSFAKIESYYRTVP